jgi:hypothetical protein
LTAHQGSKHRRPRRVSDESSDFDEICGSDHGISRYDADKPNKHLEFVAAEPAKRQSMVACLQLGAFETPYGQAHRSCERYASFAENAMFR